MRQATQWLTRQGVPDAGRDVRLLMAWAMGVTPDRVLLYTEDEMQASWSMAFSDGVARRSGREPVSRILGWREFYGRRFRITPYVLDPRPETETLVELALDGPFSEILDLGTGSGCIVLSLLAERPDAVAVATDISPHALETAAENAERLGLSDRVHFEVSDWFQAVGGRYDLIVSNPPYIDPREIMDLAPDVEQYDPKIALFDSDDGLTAYRRIVSGAGAHLIPGGRILMEIGPTQAAAVQALLDAAGLQDVAVHPDLDGRPRVVSAKARNIG